MIKTTTLKDITSGREIAAGGEGKIYENLANTNQVNKVYHKSRNKDFTDHLMRLQMLSGYFVKPIDIYVDKGLKVLGYSMEYVNLNNYFLFNNLFNKGFCTSNNIDKTFKVKLLQTIAGELEDLHKKNIIIGDLNQYNLFFNKKGGILFVDVDSYQTVSNPHSGVLLDDIRDWTTGVIDESTDTWAYDILAFWATTYCHPFKWIVPGNTQSLEERVIKGKSILTTIPGIKIPKLYEAPTTHEYQQYQEIFVDKRRYMINFKGTYIQAPLVVKQKLQSIMLDIKILYKDVIEVNCAYNYIAIKEPTIWKFVETSLKKITRISDTIECDNLYPSNNGRYMYTQGNHLYLDQGVTSQWKLLDPVFHYNEGSLTVVDYYEDVQWNFNIGGQSNGYADGKNTMVFAKSIIKRDSLLQNFGAAKYLNIGKLNSYYLAPVPSGTVNGYVHGDYTVVEVKKKNKVEYQILNASKGTKLDLDYYPYITTVGNVLLVPDDGYIQMYVNMLPSGNVLDCPVCTRNSKLYSTGSGIFLLENKTLYLLNTK